MSAKFDEQRGGSPEACAQCYQAFSWTDGDVSEPMASQALGYESVPHVLNTLSRILHDLWQCSAVLRYECEGRSLGACNSGSMGPFQCDERVAAEQEHQAEEQRSTAFFSAKYRVAVCDGWLPLGATECGRNLAHAALYEAFVDLYAAWQTVWSHNEAVGKYADQTRAAGKQVASLLSALDKANLKIWEMLEGAQNLQRTGVAGPGVPLGLNEATELLDALQAAKQRVEPIFSRMTDRTKRLGKAKINSGENKGGRPPDYALGRIFSALKQAGFSNGQIAALRLDGQHVAPDAAERRVRQRVADYKQRQLQWATEMEAAEARLRESGIPKPCWPQGRQKTRPAK